MFHLAQDELQVLEHPALYGFTYSLSEQDKDLASLTGYQVTFFQNVPRLGSLDVFSPLEVGGGFLYQIFSKLFGGGQPLYGNRFSNASAPEIHSKLKILNPPIMSNLYAILAPSCATPGKLYSRDELATLFFRALTAFYGIQKLSYPKTAVIHIGNWGAGAFGGSAKVIYLLQLAAAEFLKVDEIRIYPLELVKSFQEALQLFNQIQNDHPQMTIGAFLDHLSANAFNYGLCWGSSNGT